MGNDKSENIDNLVECCQNNNLALNSSKIKKMIVDFWKGKLKDHALIFKSERLWRVNSVRFPGIHIAHDLFWKQHIDAIIKKCHQRIYLFKDG